MTRDMREFFERRAEALAIVYLTRRDDLMVNRVVSPAGAGDFLVEITREGESTGRVFGVRVRAFEHAVERPDELMVPLGGAAAAVSDAPMPYCAFVFTMEDDRGGYFSWLNEPGTTPKSGPSLKTVREARWSKLDDGGMDRLVARVNAWYDAQHHPRAA